MQKVDIGMHESSLSNSVFHVIGICNNHLGSFFDHIINQLRNGNTRTISRIDLIDVDHPGTGNVFLGIFTPLKMSLTVPVIIVRSNKKQSESKRFFCSGGSIGSNH